MIRINWDEFKEFKKYRHNTGDNFEALLEFIKSYYNIISPMEMYEILNADELAKMMLDKRDISEAEDLENYLFKIIQ